MAGVVKAAPRLRPNLTFFRDAFYVISASRQYHMSGPQPLLRTEITDYLGTEGRWVSQSLVPYFFRLMRALDAEFLDHSSKK